MQGAVRHVGCPKDCNSMRMMENCLKFGEYVAVDDNGHTARCNGKQEVYGGMHNRTSCQAYCAVVDGQFTRLLCSATCCKVRQR